MQHKQGFTITELLITLAIMCILGAVAYPAYQNYQRRVYFSDLVEATAPYKVAVNECYQKLHSLQKCNAGKNGIPAAIPSKKGNITALTVSAGVITVTPVPAQGVVSEDLFVLTPSVTKDVLEWTPSGRSVDKGYAP